MSQFLVEAVADAMEELKELEEDEDRLDRAVETLGGEITECLDKIKRLVVMDQKPIGRTPRSNLATYTGLFDHVRKLFAATKQATPRYRIAGSTRMFVVFDQPSVLIDIGITAAGEGSDFWRPCRSKVPPV